MSKKPVMLIIMDGFGIDGMDPDHDATHVGNTKNLDYLMANYPHTQIDASEERVGLPMGQMGNSEVGHMNIGAGRVVYQDLTRINLAVRDGSIKKNEKLLRACEKAKNENRPLHILGLVSDGGVHSEMSHLFAILEMAKEQNVPKVFVHCLLDGRDVPPKSADKYILELETRMNNEGLGEIATVAGRFYTMDRDKRWDRIEKGYRALVYGEGEKATSGVEAVANSYAKDITDEFVVPCVITDNDGNPKTVIEDGDPLIFFNFRTDRPREICHVFTDETFEPFTRKKCRPYLVTMTQYEAILPVEVAFPPQSLNNTLGEVVAKAGKKQLRIAETEKFAHVTFFFNGGVDTPNEGEDRILIPSPKVATYDLQPEMSANEVCEKVNEAILSNKYDLIILNYANPDMVGHTGILEAAVKAVETVDKCVGENARNILAMDGDLLITADHGNCEVMWDKNENAPHTAHTTNPVPLIHVTNNPRTLKSGGALCDLAPTLLEMMGVEQPEDMTGHSLLEN